MIPFDPVFLFDEADDRRDEAAVVLLRAEPFFVDLEAADLDPVLRDDELDFAPVDRDLELDPVFVVLDVVPLL